MIDRFFLGLNKDDGTSRKKTPETDIFNIFIAGQSVDQIYRRPTGD